MNIINDANNKQDIHPESNQVFLSFIIGNYDFAVKMDQIKEIVMFNRLEIHSIYAPSFVKGMVYLFNHIIPIIDIHSFFKLSDVGEKFESVIFFKIKSNIFGIVTPETPNIIETNNIHSFNNSITLPNQDCIESIIEVDNKSFMLLNVEKLLLKSSCNYE